MLSLLARVRRLLARTRRSQTAFEYLLLIGGVVLLAILIVVVVRTGIITPSEVELNRTAAEWKELLQKVKVPPVLSIVSPVEDKAYNTLQIWFNVTLNRAGVRCNVNIGGADISMNGISPEYLDWWLFHSLSYDAIWNVTFYCADAEGLVSPGKTVRFFVDATPPKAWVNALPVNTTTPLFDVSWNGSDVSDWQWFSGVYCYYVEWNASFTVGGSVSWSLWQNCSLESDLKTATFNTTAKGGDGTYCFHARALDKVLLLGAWSSATCTTVNTTA